MTTATRAGREIIEHPIPIRKLDRKLWRRVVADAKLRDVSSGELLSRIIAEHFSRGARFVNEPCTGCGHPSGTCSISTTTYQRVETTPLSREHAHGAPDRDGDAT